MTMLTQKDMEAALEAGRVRWVTPEKEVWLVRRNGATKSWSSRPGAYRIPVVIGLRMYSYLTHDTQFGPREGYWSHFMVELEHA